MGTFVRRLVALTLVWLLATAALTYAASRRAASGPTPATTTTAAPAPATPATLVVPDVVDQPYVFAEGTLGDAGFSWHVEGSVQGFSANVVASQSPAPGTHVVDTGSPLIVLHLSHPAGAKEIGIPADSSPTAGTALKIYGLAAAAPTATQPLAAAKTTPAVKKTTVEKTAVTKLPVKNVPAKKSPAHRWPQNRPPAFAVPGARKEPLDEMPLTDRAKMLLRFMEAKPKPTDANVRYWLYQHAWIVAGARMGWWHGADALHTLLTVDRAVWNDWGIGEKSEAVARAALAEVDSRSS
jgi:hypothetical protein